MSRENIELAREFLDAVTRRDLDVQGNEVSIGVEAPRSLQVLRDDAKRTKPREREMVT